MYLAVDFLGVAAGETRCGHDDVRSMLQRPHQLLVILHVAMHQHH
jgi:hypothetical protein